MQNIAIVGASGHAKVVADIVACEGKHRIAGLIDPARDPGERIFGHAVLGGDEGVALLAAEHELAGVIVAIGDNFLRRRVVEHLIELLPGLALISAVHPRATVASDVVLGAGTVVMAGAIVNPGCRIGRGCILNSASSLDHDSVMGEFASLAPGAVTGGDVDIGELAAIGIGATIRHGITIGAHTVIGAGATVVEHIAAGKVAMGTPARAVRDRQPGERYL